MIVSIIILGVSFSMSGSVDGGVPSALVAKLGSGQFAEREAAARRLEGLGAEALGPLRAARDDRDPEVRSRAAALLDRIETRLLVRPTLVTLDAVDKPVAEVVRDLGARTGMAPVLDPEGIPGTTRKITIRPKSPISYWSAIDLICASAGLRSAMPPQGLGGQGGAQVLLVPAAAGADPAAPTSDSGPFRVKLARLDYHRERLLEPGLTGPAGTTHRFSAQLLVMAEPRLLLSQSGQVRLTEAVDDRGRSLRPTSRRGPADEVEVEALETGLGGPFPVTIPLDYPEPAGQSIRKLRGSIPVTVASRKGDPLVIPLAGAAGKTFQSAEASVTILAVRSDPNEPQSTIELSIRPRRPDGSVGDPGPRPATLEFLDKQVEVLDPLGRPFLHFPQDVAPAGDALRVVLVLAPVDGGVRPATLRFFGLVRASAEIPFDFQDVTW